ncbi:MAG: GntR family transcriptional regulator [Anaerolineae bacterium]|nr:GntR family transcriptional regulator [Anaerolineae bacterium]
MARNRTRSPADTTPLQKVSAPVSLKDQAYSAIKDAILSLKLKPGDALVENELAEQLGISKTPVRTALQELEREGLVTKVLYKGTYVREITPRDVREIFQLRAVLEGLAARLAAPALEESDLALARESVRLMEAALQAGDRSSASQSGARLHSLLLRKADNERLHLIWNNLDDQTERFRLMSDRISGRLEKSVGEHRGIVEALEQRDPQLAEQRVREHLHSVLEELSSEQHVDVEYGGEESRR